MPTVGIEGGKMNVVPVDYVADAMDHIAHLDGLDGKAFHLTDSEHHRMGALMNIFAHAAHAPALTMRIDTRMLASFRRSCGKAWARCRRSSASAARC